MGTASDVFGSLGSVLTQQFNIGDNKNTSLNIMENGQNLKYGKLGDFANKFDQTADRSYYEQGYRRPNFFAPKPNILNVLMQDPDATVFVKKRAFNSLAENFRPDLMDDQDRLFYKATKTLFQNKCQQISAYEKLVKIAQISDAMGGVDDSLLPILFNITDNLTDLPNAFTGLQTPISTALSGFKSIVDRVREVVALSQDNLTTSWITNIPDSFRSTFGEGTGVIELTIVESLRTTSCINFAGGDFSLSITDPYQFMRISNNDVDQALYDANNIIYQNQFIQLGITSLDQLISSRKQELNISRNGRGASSITWIVDPTTFLGKPLRALIDDIAYEIQFTGNAVSITIDPAAFFGSTTLGNQGLNADEQKTFSAIAESYYTQLSVAANSVQTSRQSNADLTYVRKKMRLHYANKLIIQPMDTVSIYLKSKTKIDNKVNSGLQSSFSGLSFMQGLQSTLTNIEQYLNNDSSFSVEKAFFVGADFPNWIWQAMRNQFVSTDKGCHVFAGVVKEAESSYANGFYSVSVSGSDNAGYFDYGVVNLKTSVDVPNGPLYDPVTPFDIQFDTVTGVQKDSQPSLLTENQGIFQSAFVKNKNGIFAGQAPSEVNYMNEDQQRYQNTNVKRVFYDPEGFVYRWKEGVATLTFNGDSYVEQPYGTQPAPAETDNPFAGQDVVNVLSLLITGQPYNFATFYKAATQFDSFARDPATGEDPASSYFRGLESALKSRNLIYGNFVPFKKLSIDEQSYAKMLKNQLTANNFDSELQQLLEKRATLGNQMQLITGNTTAVTPASGQVTADVQTIAADIAYQDTLIQNKLAAIQTTLSGSTSPVSVYGNDISLDYSPNLIVGDKNIADNNTRKQLRRQLNFLTRRLIYKVRANQDVNLLIVDDAYDKDTDIQDFEKAFTNMELFSSAYNTVSQQITTVAALLELEVFANSQGHLEIRNPQYNRMPSSVFYNMLKLKNETGAQVFPQFMEDLYATQLETLFDNIDVIEDEIRLYCAALGYISDTDCVGFIGSSTGLLNVPSSGTVAFRFISNEITGKCDSNDLRYIVQNSNPDDVLNRINNSLSAVTSNSFANQANLKNTFDIGRITNYALSLLNAHTNTIPIPTNVTFQNSANNRIQTITTRLASITSIPPDITQLFGTTTSVAPTVITGMALLSVLNSIAGLIGSRQKSVKTAANALRNLQESVTLNTRNNNTTNNVLLPNLNNSTQIPQVFEHMIEDESYDDLGPGSGARYIINDYNILSYSISEKRPKFTAVQVEGSLGDQFVSGQQLPSDLNNNLFKNGNALTTAAAVDYDLWRMYGISLPQDIKVPAFTDADTQCAPYAVSVLNRMRKSVFQGNMVVIGNEYQQPGEVIYIEHLDLLYYVETVTHNFTFGSGFTTTMNLTYGHNAGEYIPTPFDVIGKLLYKNKDISNYSHNKQGSVFNQQHIGTLIGNYGASNPTANLDQNTAASSSPLSDIINGQFAQSNTAYLQKIIDQGNSALSTGTANYNPILEVRIYFNSSNPSYQTASPYNLSLANAIQQYLIGATTLTGNTQTTGNTNTNPQTLSAFAKTNQVQVKVIDSSTEIVGEYRYPSAKAFYYARMALANNSSSSAPTSAAQQTYIDNIIYGAIVDCWIVFKNPNNKMGL